MKQAYVRRPYWLENLLTAQPFLIKIITRQTFHKMYIRVYQSIENISYLSPITNNSNYTMDLFLMLELDMFPLFQVVRPASRLSSSPRMHACMHVLVLTMYACTQSSQSLTMCEVHGMHAPNPVKAVKIVRNSVSQSVLRSVAQS